MLHAVTTRHCAHSNRCRARACRPPICGWALDALAREGVGSAGDNTLGGSTSGNGAGGSSVGGCVEGAYGIIWPVAAAFYVVSVPLVWLIPDPIEISPVVSNDEQ